MVEAGRPHAFREVRLADEQESAPSSEGVREAVHDVAQKGSNLQRFKGLE